MQCDNGLNREVIEKFSTLTDKNKATVIATLVESLFEQAVVSSDRQLENELNL
jgi:hypothetical protein